MAFPHDGKKFQKGKTGNPNGRPPKTVKLILQSLSEKGYEVPTAGQIKDAYLYLAAMPQEELKKLVDDKEAPMLFRICASNILSKKGFDIIERMLDRAIGKALQKTEISGEIETTTNIDLKKLSIDELRQLQTIVTKLETDTASAGIEEL